MDSVSSALRTLANPTESVHSAPGPARVAHESGRKGAMAEGSENHAGGRLDHLHRIDRCLAVSAPAFTTSSSPRSPGRAVPSTSTPAGAKDHGFNEGREDTPRSAEVRAAG